jgi:hypothetical protein
MYRPYKPKTDGGQLIWYPNFKAKLPTYMNALGLSPQEVSDGVASCDAITDSILNDQNHRNEAAMALAEKKQTQKDEGAKITNLVARLKTSAGYTPAIGEDLGVIGGTIPFDPATYRPLLRGTTVFGGTRLSWVRGDAKVMKLFMRLKGQTEWKVLTISTSSFFDDRTPLAQPNVPEIREYMVCGCINDQEVGNPSDIVSAVFAG